MHTYPSRLSLFQAGNVRLCLEFGQQYGGELVALAAVLYARGQVERDECKVCVAGGFLILKAHNVLVALGASLQLQLIAGSRAVPRTIDIDLGMFAWSCR